MHVYCTQLSDNKGAACLLKLESVYVSIIANVRKVLEETEIVSVLGGASLTPFIVISTALFNDTIGTKKEGNAGNWRPIDPLFNHVIVVCKFFRHAECSIQFPS